LAAKFRADLNPPKKEPQGSFFFVCHSADNPALRQPPDSIPVSYRPRIADTVKYRDKSGRWLMNKTQETRTPRETEPLPKTVKPALLFLLFLAGVVATMAIAAYAVDRMIYG
jgi:hypothetical protein